MPKNTRQRKQKTGLEVKLEKGDLKTLGPFFDDEAIRVGGHVNPNLLSYDGKYEREQTKKMSAQYLPYFNYKTYINQILLYSFSFKVC